ncbi:hypothetical protein [Nonomuraea sp. LPB2021202275-12-8]|uniref:hypothetical protein n=1 Tax=Nonomuraea sp. LPB2021202275-12-8 TaxID=3120159 RepID=UPI00300C935E
MNPDRLQTFIHDVDLVVSTTHDEHEITAQVAERQPTHHRHPRLRRHHRHHQPALLRSTTGQAHWFTSGWDNPEHTPQPPGNAATLSTS